MAVFCFSWVEVPAILGNIGSAHCYHMAGVVGGFMFNSNTKNHSYLRTLTISSTMGVC